MSVRPLACLFVSKKIKKLSIGFNFLHIVRVFWVYETNKDCVNTPIIRLYTYNYLQTEFRFFFRFIEKCVQLLDLDYVN